MKQINSLICCRMHCIPCLWLLVNYIMNNMSSLNPEAVKYFKIKKKHYNNTNKRDSCLNT